jgi:acyl-CoA synthetase (AMP-forming)/AMP-acid ligase II
MRRPRGGRRRLRGAEELIVGATLAGKVAKRWRPDDVLMLEELPHTATGKLNKLALRARYQDHLIENAKSLA